MREPTGPLADLGTKTGLLPRQRIKGLIRRRMIQASVEIDETQIQPASLDLRLGTKAYRVPASFLPGKGKTVEQQLSELEFDEINLEAGAVLERGTVYVVELMEHLSLPESVSALANPKSSTGRLDVFTRLIADHSDVFDSVPGGYRRQDLHRDFALQLQHPRAQGIAAQSDQVSPAQSGAERTAKFTLVATTICASGTSLSRWSMATSNCATA